MSKLSIEFSVKKIYKYMDGSFYVSIKFSIDKYKVDRFIQLHSFKRFRAETE